MLGAIIYAIGGLIEALIGLRFVLELIGANPASPFAGWIYSWSAPFVAPFAGLFGQSATILNTPGVAATSVFDWTALIALVIIGLIVSLAGRLLR